MEQVPISQKSDAINASLQDVVMIEMINVAHVLAQIHLTQRAKNQAVISSIEEEDLTEHELVEAKLESIGYRVGQGLVERFSDQVPLTSMLTHLDLVKYICKDIWQLLFNKQIDNLKTNHRGVYVLVDNNFRWFNKMSQSPALQNSRVSKEQIHWPYLWFPCGIIRGALANLGTVATVIAESPTGYPSITFQIKIDSKEKE